MSRFAELLRAVTSDTETVRKASGASGPQAIDIDTTVAVFGNFAAGMASRFLLGGVLHIIYYTCITHVKYLSS